MPFYLVPVQQGRTIPLDKPILFFGRHPECDVVLTRSRKVSRKHCCVAQVDQQFFVRDLGSMNGIRVNGARVERLAPLRLGDEIAIGDVTYRLQAQPTADSAASRPAGDTRPDRQPRPEELSLEFPVPIPEDDEEFDESARVTPEAVPVIDPLAVGDDLLEESGEFNEQGSRR